jgi:predicted ester cyclase
MVGFHDRFHRGFPDSRISIEACIAEGDSVVTRWTLTGTHQGMFQGIPPTGRPVRFNGIEFNRVLNGRLVEHWSMFDNLLSYNKLARCRRSARELGGAGGCSPHRNLTAP